MMFCHPLLLQPVLILKHRVMALLYHTWWGYLRVVSSLTHIFQYTLSLMVLQHTFYQLDLEQLSFWLQVMTMFHRQCQPFFYPYAELGFLLLTASHNTNALADIALFLLNTIYIL